MILGAWIFVLLLDSDCDTLPACGSVFFPRSFAFAVRCRLGFLFCAKRLSFVLCVLGLLLAASYHHFYIPHLYLTCESLRRFPGVLSLFLSVCLSVQP